MKAIAILNSKGRVNFLQTSNGVIIKFNLTGFSPNSIHAIHIHEFGDMSNGCISLGGHYNPEGKHHGHWSSCCRHEGDLMNNFKADRFGNFSWSYIDPYLSVQDILGRSVVIHELEDDLGKQNYENLDDKTLNSLCELNGYLGLKTRQDKIKKLNDGSLLTGNAGKRMDCAIIGLCQ